jgi:hypothetical protein
MSATIITMTDRRPAKRKPRNVADRIYALSPEDRRVILGYIEFLEWRADRDGQWGAATSVASS